MRRNQTLKIVLIALFAALVVRGDDARGHSHSRVGRLCQRRRRRHLDVRVPDGAGQRGLRGGRRLHAGRPAAGIRVVRAGHAGRQGGRRAARWLDLRPRRTRKAGGTRVCRAAARRRGRRSPDGARLFLLRGRAARRRPSARRAASPPTSAKASWASPSRRRSRPSCRARTKSTN